MPEFDTNLENVFEMSDNVPRGLRQLLEMLLWFVPVLALFAIVWLALSGDLTLPSLPPNFFSDIKGLFGPVESIFIAILVESLPFVVFGALLSSLIHEFVPEDRLVRWLPKQPLLAGLMAGLLGLVIPVCDCGTIPIARSLLHKGVPKSVVVTFTLAAPVVNPVTVVATFVAFGFNVHLALTRVAVTYIIACVVGFVIASIDRSPNPGLIALSRSESAATLGPSLGTSGRVALAWRHFKAISEHTVNELFGIAGFLIISAGIASVYQVYHTKHFGFGHHSSGITAVGTLMILAVVFSLCSEADAFVARSFAVSYSPGSVMAFMLIGQMTDLRNLFLLPKTFGLKTGAVVVSVSAVLCFSVGMLL